MSGANSTGKRSDEDLVANWKNDKANRFADKTAAYVTNARELMDTDMSKVDFVLGKRICPSGARAECARFFFF